MCLGGGMSYIRNCRLAQATGLIDEAQMEKKWTKMGWGGSSVWGIGKNNVRVRNKL